jgi:ATP-dependent helicase HrpB
MTGGRGVTLAAESIVRDAELFLAIEVDAGPEPAPGRPVSGGDALVRVASAIRREWLQDAFPDRIEERTRTFYDATAGRVRATASVHYRDLPLEEPRDRRPEPEEAARLLAEAVRPRAEEILLGNEAAAAFLRRARALGEWMPELGLPAFDADLLGSAIADACAGKLSLDDVRKSDLDGLLRARLTHAQLSAIERHAPEMWKVPAGRAVRLEYEPGRPPVLAARVQELFGLADTPAIAGGRVRLLLHILAPNNRPVQVTQDLRSFWDTTYARVRKDLRGRYPKHSWPEDPWSASPESRPRRRR